MLHDIQTLTFTTWLSTCGEYVPLKRMQPAGPGAKERHGWTSTKVRKNDICATNDICVTLTMRDTNPVHGTNVTFVVQCHHGRSKGDDGAYHAFRHLTDASTEELREFAICYMQFNKQHLPEQVMACINDGTFDQYVMRHAVATLPVKPDIVLVLSMLRIGHSCCFLTC